MSDRRSFLLPAFVLSLVTSSAGAAFAQSSPPPDAMASPSAMSSPAPGARIRHNRMRAALASLGLSDDQKSKIKEIMKNYRASRRTATPMTHEQVLEQIDGVLTPDQQTQFKTAMTSARRTHPAFRQGQPTAAPDASPSP